VPFRTPQRPVGQGCTTLDLAGSVARSTGGRRSISAFAGSGCKLTGVTAFEDFRRAVDARHGVGDVEVAAAHGVSRNLFYRRTSREAWGAPLPRVRTAPDAPRSVQRDLLTVCGATSHLAAASSLTAAWLHGLRPRPPRPATFVVAHGTDLPTLARTSGHRARWLTAEDVTEVDGVPVVTGAALPLSAAHLGHRAVRSLIIDAVFHGSTTATDVLARAAEVGPIEGRGWVVTSAEELRDLLVESVFQDDVAAELERLGYAPDRSTQRIATPDGHGLEVDVPLPRWQVAVEPEGDAFHQTRKQRRADRRRAAAYAGTDWVQVPVDWRDWLDDRPHVLAAIDAAIAGQRRRRLGTAHAPPQRA
jgi:hypothetical protein